jgi:hypothetical protein
MAEPFGDLGKRKHARSADSAKEKRAPCERPGNDPFIHAAGGY